jgi:hypothetical protein
MSGLRAVVLVGGCLVLAASGLGNETRVRALMIGDKAPRIFASEWANGEVSRFQPGKTYVVVFWNSTSKPALGQFTNLKLRKKEFGSKIDVVAVNVFDPAKDVFGRLPAEHPSIIFAKDKPSRFTDLAIQSETGVAWMGAAGQNQVPFSFIVDGKGRVAWLGPTFDLANPLKQIVDGKWDIERASAAYARRIKVQQGWGELAGKIEKAISIRDYKLAEEFADEGLQAGLGFPAIQAKLRVLGLRRKHREAFAFLDSVLARKSIPADWTRQQKLNYAGYTMGDGKLSGQLLRKLIAGPWKNDSNALNGASWAVVDPRSGHRKPDLESALLAAKRSVELDRQPYNIDTLARVYFVMGDLAKACKLQREAIAMNPVVDKQSYVFRLGQYDTALKNRGRRPTRVPTY